MHNPFDIDPMPVLYFPFDHSDSSSAELNQAFSRLIKKRLPALSAPQAVVLLRSHSSGSSIEISPVERSKPMKISLSDGHQMGDVSQFLYRRLKQQSRDVVVSALPEPASGPGLDWLDSFVPDYDGQVIRISVLDNQDPESQLLIGESLAWLLEHACLVIAEGHPDEQSDQLDDKGLQDLGRKTFLFDQWLNETMTSATIVPAMRKTMLAHWEKAPHAKAAYSNPSGIMPMHLATALVGYKIALPVWQGVVADCQLTAFIWFPE